MHVDHHNNKLEQKKVLNRLLSVEKLAIVFYLLYFVVRWPFHDIIGGDLQFKSFSLSSCDTKTFGQFCYEAFFIMKIMTERLVRG